MRSYSPTQTVRHARWCAKWLFHCVVFSWFDSAEIHPQVYTDPRSLTVPSTAPRAAVNNQPYQSPTARAAVQLTQAPIASYLYEYQQFAAANNNNIQFAQPSTHHRAHQPVHNGSAMYQSNIGMVVPNANNGVMSHTNGMVNNYAPVQGLTANLPIHPDVRLKKLAFFDQIAVLLKPSTLIPTSSSQRMQENTYQFSLTPSQATEIGMNRDTRNSNKVEHVVQVQLRFCLLETSCEQEDYFPPNVVVKVNNKLQQLPVSSPTTFTIPIASRNKILIGFSIWFAESNTNQQTWRGTEATASTRQCYTKCEIIADGYKHYNGILVHRLQSRFRRSSLFGQKTDIVAADAAHERQGHQTDRLYSWTE